MTLDDSSLWYVIKTSDGFALISPTGDDIALYSNRGEAEQIAAMMNEQILFQHELQTQSCPHDTTPIPSS